MYDFDQGDLDEEDVMLLDTWEEVRGQISSNPKHVKWKTNSEPSQSRRLKKKTISRSS